jgi:hypothetical protein
MASFSWTHYSFRSPAGPLSAEAWLALRATTPKEHDVIIETVKAERWKQFWKDQSFFKWCLWGLAGGIVLWNVAEGNSSLKTIAALGCDRKWRSEIFWMQVI